MPHITYTDSRIKNAVFTVFLGALCLGFVINAMAGEVSEKGWIWGLLFILAFPLALMNTISPGRMTLHQSGFEIKMFLKSHKVRWDEIEEIKFYKMYGNHFFKFKKYGEKWKSKNQQLPMGFKVKPKEFAQIMLAFHSAAQSRHLHSSPYHQGAAAVQHPERMAGIQRGGRLFGG